MHMTTLNTALAPVITAPVLLGLAAWAGLATAHSSPQEARIPAQRAWCSNVLVPQGRSLHVDRTAPQVSVAAVDADIAIDGQVATTTLTLTARNDGPREGEAEILIPVPEDAVVTAFDFEGVAAEPTAKVLAKDEAIATYRSIVAKLRDPALLEFSGHGALRTSVFPVPANGTTDVRISYRTVLANEDDRIDYVLPRSATTFGVRPPAWTIRATIRANEPIADIYSPTHPIVASASSTRESTLEVSAGPSGTILPGDFRLAILSTDEALGNMIFTTANPDGDGGWFLFLATAGEELVRRTEDAPPREVTLVIDRSGSMSGEKFEQAVEAARQIVESLEYGEALQIIDYANDVARFAPAPVVKTKANIEALRGYLASLKSNGGTNLDGALGAALDQEPSPGFLPVVLFLTDGLPTEGETREHVIRERAEARNEHDRRIFTFGVGNDVNAPLLDAVALASRGRATYVRPSEDVESAIGDVFEGLSGPLVTDLTFEALDETGAKSTRAIRDVHPRVLPDLYTGDRVLVLGRYLGGVDAATLRLTGKRGSKPIVWHADANLAHDSTEYDFVRRLWAMRQVAALEDDLRTRGADPTALAALRDDPQFEETIAALLDVATRHGVLSDSTAFLARAGALGKNGEEILALACSGNLDNNMVRSGEFGVAQQLNIKANRSQAWITSNQLLDANGQRSNASGVVQAGCRAFFAHDGKWLDGRLALADSPVEPDRTVVIGTEEYEEVLDALHIKPAARRGELAGRPPGAREWRDSAHPAERDSRIWRRRDEERRIRGRSVDEWSAASGPAIQCARFERNPSLVATAAKSEIRVLSSSPTVCVVEDDPAIRRGLVDTLRFAGYATLECADGDSARATLGRAEVDLVLLDVVLPGLDGLEYVRELRKAKPRLPIIMVTARGAEADRVRGLRGGADDYVVKPFSATELLARVEAVLRRTAERPSDVAMLKFGELVVDLERHEVRASDGVSVPLTEKESALLGYFARNAGRTLDRDELLRCVWGLEPRGLDTRTVDMAVARIREKCGKDSIRTVRGQGYAVGDYTSAKVESP